jgi:hypothetical protein
MYELGIPSNMGALLLSQNESIRVSPPRLTIQTLSILICPKSPKLAPIETMAVLMQPR